MHHRSPSFFDLETQFAKIYKLNDFLPKLKQLIPWENFRPTLEQIHHKDRLSNAGRKPFDAILMFKILVLQTIYNLGIEQQLFDRFHHELDARGFGINSGLIVDSTFVEVPRQHNTREENEQIKRGEVPERFAQNANVASHKDTDATYSRLVS